MTTLTSRPVLPGLAAAQTLLRSRRADPARVGAIAPTSRRAALALSRSVPTTGRPVVLELGAGTGAITRVLRDRIPEGGRVIALESDPDLVSHLRGALPGAHPVQADARDLEYVLDDAGVDRVDAVVSSLPLTLMTPGVRRAILAAAAQRLLPHGELVTITYRSPRSEYARTLAADLSVVFDRVETSRPIWANLPPARLVYGRGPRPC